MSAGGRVAFVTGAGRNVGAAIAGRLARDGDRIVVVDLDPLRAGRTASEIGAGGGAAHAVVGDVSDSADVQRMVAEAVSAFGGIDVLVNNVAITDRGKTVLELAEQEWERVLRVTLGSTFLCTKYVARQMVAQGRGGRIVNIGSTSGHRGRGNATAYPAAKAAVLNVTRSFAVQLAPHGIRVNTVTPNKVGSPVGEDVEPDDRKRSNLIGRGAVPDDIANAVAFLVSDEADFITATELLVDGGALHGAAMD